MTDRFTVTELTGYATMRKGAGGSEGLSCCVIDTAWNYRLLATYRSEDYTGTGHTNMAAKRHVRELAAAHAARLTAHMREDVQAARERES